MHLLTIALPPAKLELLYQNLSIYLPRLHLEQMPEGLDIQTERREVQMLH